MDLQGLLVVTIPPKETIKIETIQQKTFELIFRLLRTENPTEMNKNLGLLLQMIKI